MSSSPTLLFATHNANKRRELAPIFARALPPHWQLLDLSQWPVPVPEVIEDRDSFEGNAIKKALETSLFTETNVISEDSGLVVDALDGAPGIYSARFSGPDATAERNNALLIERLNQADPSRVRRSARFVAFYALALLPDASAEHILARLGTSLSQVTLEGEPSKPWTPSLAQGRIVLWWSAHLEGEIVDEPRGQFGFGYDPHFLVPSYQRTVAELEPELKNAISHRARAIEALVQRLGSDDGGP